MDINLSLLAWMAIIIIALWAKPLLERHNIPFTLLLVLLGFIASELLVKSGIDTGVRASNFQTLNSLIFLPLLIYSTAFRLNIRTIKQNKMAITLLAAIGPLICTSLGAVIIYYGINHPAGFPFIAALITAAMLAAISSRAISDLLTKCNVSPRVVTLLESESLLTSPVAITLFGLFIEMATHSAEKITPLLWLTNFTWMIVGGILIGLCTGFIMRFFMKPCRDGVTIAIMTLASCYFSYLLANEVLFASGAIATFITALLCNIKIKTTLPKKNLDFVLLFWKYNSLFATTCVFLLVGITITWPMFSERWLAMLVGIVAIVTCRLISVYGLLRFVHKPSVPLSEKHIIAAGGLRGAIVIAMAFSVPIELDYWWTIQAIAFGVVLFSLLLQTPLTSMLLKWTKS